MVLPFGHYKGFNLRDIPDSYLLWLCERGKSTYYKSKHSLDVSWKVPIAIWAAAREEAGRHVGKGRLRGLSQKGGIKAHFAQISKLNFMLKEAPCQQQPVNVVKCLSGIHSIPDIEIHLSIALNALK